MMTIDITEDNAVDFQWVPLKLVHFLENCWVLVPDDAKLSKKSEYRNIEVGVDVAQFGPLEDGEYYECLLFEYGVLLLFAVMVPDWIVREAVEGDVSAQFLSEGGTQSYTLHYRVRQ